MRLEWTERSLAAIATLMVMAQVALAETDPAVLAEKVQAIADVYVSDTAPSEKATGISISISLPGGAAPVNVVSGQVGSAPDAAPMTPDTLFQIGSITKSFTAAALLQLQSEGKLDLDDTLGLWLPEYPAWQDVTLRRLLNMTSGIPSYDDADATLESIAAVGLSRRFTPQVLAGFVDPAYPGAPAPTEGYSYSNTNYALAGMVIERASGESVREIFESRFLGDRYGLTSTYYSENVYPPEITGRMASGYFVAEGYPPMKDYDGADMKAEDMSWAGPAGGIVSRPEDVNRWVSTLFASEALLDPAARGELTQLVSMRTGAPLDALSTDEPTGFGLGVSGFMNALGIGWQYEGETMGYRVLYVYLPKRDLVATLAFNSAAEGAADHAGKVALEVIGAALE
jgi:D-alanyl-D-alanine carboxypeptidase